MLVTNSHEFHQADVAKPGRAFQLYLIVALDQVALWNRVLGDPLAQPAELHCAQLGSVQEYIDAMSSVGKALQ